MKIVVTGSLGNISQPLSEKLIQQGHQVTIITGSPSRQQQITNLGATAAVGNITDGDFLATTFKGADAVYCMVPPNYQTNNPVRYYKEAGQAYFDALQASSVRHIVFLSSWGAHQTSGTGIILGSHHVEEILKPLSAQLR